MEIKNITISSYDRVWKKNIQFIEPNNLDEVIANIKIAKNKNKKVCFRGSGKSYGDQNFLSKDGLNISIKKINKILNFDESKKEVEVETGLILSDLLNYLNSKGYTLNCVPGIKDITIGGAIANNVHGKDSYFNGFFLDHSTELKYYNAKEDKIDLIKNDEKSFKYFFGSKGQFGFVYSVKLKVYPFYNCVKVKRIFFNNLEELRQNLSVMKKYQFSYIYLNNFEKGKKLGCGFIELGSNVNKKINNSYYFEKLKILIVKLLFRIIHFMDKGRFFMKIINKIFINFQKVKKNFFITTFEKYNFPHQTIPSFYNTFYPEGFYEIQFYIKEKELIKILDKILNFLQENFIESYFTGVKLHNKNQSLINFECMPTYSVGIDIDKRKVNEKIIKKISSILKDFDCTIYFAKDSLFSFEDLSKSQIKNLNYFMEIKKKYDPDFLYSSDLINRIR